MAYATLADLTARFGADELIQLTDRAGLGEIDGAVIGQALEDADAVIDGHLAGRYALPLNPTPPILVGYACDLARVRLYTDAAPETVQQRAEEARKFLAMVGRGQISLGVQPEPVARTDAVQVLAGRTRRIGL